MTYTRALEDKEKKYSSLWEKIFDLLKNNPDAIAFLRVYSERGELIDDIVDEEKDIDKINQASYLSSLMFSSNYWIQNCDQLMLIEGIVNCLYFASTKWETAEEAWKRRDAKVISHCGYYMMFAVLLLETKNVVLVRELALEFMERCHLQHLNDLDKETLNA
jgi:hypothetical protein